MIKKAPISQENTKEPRGRRVARRAPNCPECTVWLGGQRYHGVHLVGAELTLWVLCSNEDCGHSDIHKEISNSTPLFSQERGCI